ncbi:MAG: flagellar M-ring protein FliF [Armatimonadetes bacterium]|nr:flagellar M-ring protein FliF [Armatimonadota bacterium]
MNEFFKRIREQTQQIWARMNRGQRIGVVASLATLFLALGLMLFMSNRLEKHKLYTELTAEDAEVVIKDLKERNVKYELADNGTSVLVYGPRKQLDEIRIELAAKGVPKSGGVGWEFLEKQQFGETHESFVQKQQRAMETELKRTIETMSNISKARVALAQPEDSLFLEEQKDPTASVTLEVKPNERVNERQVLAIQNLVAHSVPKLKPENVSVTDTNGNLLSVDDNQMPMGLSAKQWEIQRDYQQMVQKSVQSLLDRSFGPNNAVARIGLELDFSKRSVAKEIYTNPRNEVKVSEQSKNESYAGGEVRPGGPNGTTSNIPSYPGIYAQGPNDYRQTEKIVNYAPTKIIDERVKAPAEVKRITVGVLVDEDKWKKANVKVAQMEDVIALAAGFKKGELNSDGQEKGNVTISPVNFFQAPETPRSEELWWLKYLPLLLLVGIAFITFLMLGAMMQPKRQIPARAPRKAVITPAAALPTLATSPAIPAGVAGAAIAVAAGGTGIQPIGGGIPQIASAETPRGFWESLEEQREEAERRLLSDIETALQDSPRVSTDLLRGWMKQDRATEGKERARA